MVKPLTVPIERPFTSFTEKLVVNGLSCFMQTKAPA